MNDVVTMGIDLAKNVFAVHGIDATGRVVLRRMVTRAKLPQLVAQLPPCLIACCPQI
jgi:transposase